MLTTVLEWLILVVIAILGVTLIPWLRRKMGKEKSELLHRLIITAVEAAEQLFDASAGTQKLEYVCRLLSEHGITVDDSVRMEIEATVLALKHALQKETAQ